MKDLLLYIARSLVEHPDDVTVTEKQGADELTSVSYTHLTLPTT